MRGVTWPRNNIGLVFLVLRVADDALKELVEISRTGEGILGVWIHWAANINVQLFAALACWSTMQLHIRWILVAFIQGRPERTQRLVISTFIAYRVVGRVNIDHGGDVNLGLFDNFNDFRRMFTFNGLSYAKVGVAKKREDILHVRQDLSYRPNQAVD